MSINEILALDKYQRIAVLNQISGVRSAHLIGSKNASGASNLAIFNSMVHIGANPPLMGFIMRPLTVERHTYHNIKDTGCFTVNHISIAQHQKAHQTSAKYPSDVSEFEACGFEEEYLGGFKAPYVKTSPIKLGLTFVEDQLIKANQTRLVIGKVEEIYIANEAFDKEGRINFENLELSGVSGLDTYYSFKKLGTYPFARP